VVIGVILVELDWEIVGETFSGLNWRTLVLGFAVYLCNYLLRSYRFKILLRFDRRSFTRLMGATSLYGMYLYLLPAKSGELSYPVILKRNFDISITQSAAMLIAARFFDFATIALFVPLVMVIYWEQLPHWFLYSGLFFCGSTVILAVILIWLLRNKTASDFKSLNRIKNRWISRLGQSILNLYHWLQIIDRQRQKVQIWLVTIGIWLLVYTNFFLIVSSMGYHFSYFQMIVVSILMLPMTIMPFQGFANLGTHEIGWVVAFSIFGQSVNTALAIAVGSHIIMLFFVLVLGLLGFVLLKTIQPAVIPGMD
jgi:uncharacterized protein (TIRG00374 family)